MLEALQNAFDERAGQVTVELGAEQVVVEDDAEGGIGDERLVYTIFLSDKPDDPTRRGRMGRGLKELLAGMDRATVETVGTTVEFSEEGRRSRENERARGTRLVLGRRFADAIPVFCCCGMTVLGAPTPTPATPVSVPTSTPEEQPPGTVAVVDPAPEPADPAPAEPATPSPSVATTDEVAEGDAPEAEVGLPGFGATRAHWEATHQSSPGFAPGAVFGPMVQSWESDRLQPTYATVFGDDRIISYAVNMTRGTNFAAARARMLRELPPDAREVRTRRLPQCRMIRYRSPTLRRIFAEEVQAHGGDVEVGYFSADPDRFDPRRVTMTTIGFYVGEDIDC